MGVAEVTMGAKNPFFKGPASPTKPKVTAKAKPLSPGSNYPATKNIQTQSNGFGTFLTKFTVASSKKNSQFGMPVFLPNGNVNPAYLEAKRKQLIAKKKFELADYIKKKIGEVGSGK